MAGRRKRANVMVRLGRDESGAVMVMTLIVAFLLVKVCMSAFNMGVLTSQKIRLQLTADAAAYSSAIWQARWLNYCAYTRRAIIGNYALLPLVTAMDSNHEHITYYYDEKPFQFPPLIPCLGMTIDPDNIPGFPRITVSIIKPLYDLTTGAWVDTEGRETAEHLSKLHAEAQRVMLAYAGNPHLTTIPSVVQAANKDVGSGKLPEIELPTAFLATYAAMVGVPGFLDMGVAPGMINGNWYEKQDITELQEDVDARRDRFTDATLGLFPPSPLPFFASRGYWAFDIGGMMATYPGCGSISICGIDSNDKMVTFIASLASAADNSIEDKHSAASDFGFGGTYHCGWIGPDPFTTCGYAPCTTGILDFKSSDAEYDHQYGEGDISLYKIKDNLSASNREPSVYVALKIKRENLIKDDGTGPLIHNVGMPLGDSLEDLVVVSRAKVYFQPRYDGESEPRFVKPNIYYPYWDAKLAPYFGSGFTSAPTTLQLQGGSFLTAMWGADDFDMPDPFSAIEYYSSINH